MVQLALVNTKFIFQRSYGIGFALIKVNNGEDGHMEVIRLESDRFRRYLSKIFYDNQGGRVVNSEAISNALQVLQAQTEYTGSTIPLLLRVGCMKQGDDELTFYYDLTNPQWQYIKITKQQWELVDNNSNDNSQILFVRYNQTSQVLLNETTNPTYLINSWD